MNQNKKIAILIGTVLSVFAVLLVFVYLGNSKRMNAGVEKNGPGTNLPVAEQQGDEEQIKDQASLGESSSEKGDQGEVFDGILSKKMDDKIVVKKNDNGEELEFYLQQDTKITLMKLFLKDSAKKDTELEANNPITLNDISEGDNLSIVGIKTKERGDDSYLANEIKKIELSLGE